MRPIGHTVSLRAIAAHPHDLVWDSSDHLLFAVTTHVATTTAVESLIRCSARTGSCDVALRDMTGPADDFYPPVGTTPPVMY